jgi:hypothetical protein
MCSQLFLGRDLQSDTSYSSSGGSSSSSSSSSSIIQGNRVIGALLHELANAIDAPPLSR